MVSSWHMRFFIYYNICLDELLAAVASHQQIIYTLLEMMKSKVHDTERWSAGVQGLLMLRLF